MAAVGIDLGTTFSCCAIFRCEEGDRKEEEAKDEKDEKDGVADGCQPVAQKQEVGKKSGISLRLERQQKHTGLLDLEKLDVEPFIDMHWSHAAQRRGMRTIVTGSQREQG
eukprot:766361-Hanusia_phi.AAC.2